VDALADTRQFLEALLVRPTKGGAPSGAWAGTVGDAGLTDADKKANGAVVLLLSRLRPIGQSPELLPPVLIPNDVLAVVDPNSLEVYVSKLVGTP
jgi:hypothetical protein